MIAIDTSAIMAIILNEPDAQRCSEAIKTADRLIISAGTVVETLIVTERRNVAEQAARLIEGLNFEVVAVTSASARRTAEAYRAWGKGMHPAALNFGDCFAYEVAKEYDCPLLFVGNDFAQTDLVSAID